MIPRRPEIMGTLLANRSFAASDHAAAPPRSANSTRPPGTARGAVAAIRAAALRAPLRCRSRQPERGRSRCGDDDETLLRRRAHGHDRRFGLEGERLPVAESEMPRRPHDLLGDAAELRPDLLSDVGTIAVEIQASEDVP